MNFALILAFAAQEDIEGAIKKLSDAASYSFKLETKVESDNDRFKDMGGKVEGKFEKDVGLVATTETSDIVRVGKSSFTRPKAIWRKEPDEQDGPRQGPPDGQPGGRGRGMGGGGPRGFQGRVHPPHEDLAHWEMRNIHREEKEKLGDAECDVFTAELTDDACKAILPFGRMMGRGGDSSDARGTIKGYVSGDGQLVKIEAQLSVTLSFNGNETSFKLRRTVEISALGSTKVEIPEDVKKLLKE